MPEHEMRVGVIGTGAMGSRFARRLVADGYEVHAYNRTHANAASLADIGVQLHTTPRSLAEATDAIVCMVWDSDALRAIALGDDGFIAGLSSGQVIADASTVEPVVSAEIARQVAAAGGAMLDMPVSGSLDLAEAGQLLIMVGGPLAALDRIRPVLDALARLVVHVSETNGSGLAMKLAINMQVAAQAVAWGEGLAIAESFGIARTDAMRVMLDSVIASPMIRYRAPFVVQAPAEVWASAAQLRKDVAYAIDACASPLPSGVLALGILDEIIAGGDGDNEAAELMRWVADRRTLAMSAGHVTNAYDTLERETIVR